MDTTILHFLPSKSPLPAILISPRKPPTTTAMPLLLSRPRRCLRIVSINSTSDSNSSSRDTPGNDAPSPTPVPPSTSPTETVEIRFRRGSRKRRQQMKDGPSVGQAMKAQASPPAPKKWEDMSVTEKAIELYVGEKGLLFWLNKFAYASIFVVIGGWILFRFVGPSLNLYQLDTPPLAPTSILKGS